MTTIDHDRAAVDDQPDVPVRRNVFAEAQNKVWKYRFNVELLVTDLTGGIPNDPRVIEGWLRAKLQNTDVALEETLAETIASRNAAAEDGKVFTRDDAIDEHIKTANLNGFKRNDDGILVVEGRQVKAAVKEAFNVANAGGHFSAKRWGATNKGLTGFVAEHVFIPARTIAILHEDGTPFLEPTGVQQRFVHTWRGASIAYEEFCNPAVLQFQLWSDWDFKEGNTDLWPTVWTIGGFQGVGATRSQGCGVYDVTRWDAIK